MNMIYKRTAVQQCEKQNQSIGGSCAEKMKLFYFCPPPPMAHTRYGRDLDQPKIIFFQLCYLDRVEHEKCSEMCVQIDRFTLKLRKWDCFYKKGQLLKK